MCYKVCFYKFRNLFLIEQRNREFNEFKEFREFKKFRRDSLNSLIFLLPL